MKSRCVRCQEKKDSIEFYKNPAKTNGLNSWCKQCSRGAAKRKTEELRARSLLGHEPREPGMCRALINLGSFTLNVTCSRTAAPGTGGFCLAHTPHDHRERVRRLQKVLSGEVQFGSKEYRKRKIEERDAIIEAARSDPEIADLIEAQERDDRVRSIGAHWITYLDAEVWAGVSMHDRISTEHLRGYTTDAWTDVVIEIVDRQREIDQWAA